MTIESKTITDYGAELIDYEIGACDISDYYFKAPNSMRPIPLIGRYGTRKISFSIDFFGNSENTVVENIAKLTADLLKGAELTFTDGFYYYCVLEKAGTPVRRSHCIYTASFDLIGVRHGQTKTHTFSAGGSADIDGQCEAPAKFTITGGSGSYSVNGISITGISGTVIIDGFNKTVKQNGVNFFSHCSMSKFPTVKPGFMTFTTTGTGTLKVEYQPVYL